jgi:hypothetical protein
MYRKEIKYKYAKQTTFRNKRDGTVQHDSRFVQILINNTSWSWFMASAVRTHDFTISASCCVILVSE